MIILTEAGLGTILYINKNSTTAIPVLSALISEVNFIPVVDACSHQNMNIGTNGGEKQPPCLEETRHIALHIY